MGEGGGANPIYKIGLRSGVLVGDFEKNPKMHLDPVLWV